MSKSWKRGPSGPSKQRGSLMMMSSGGGAASSGSFNPSNLIMWDPQATAVDPDDPNGVATFQAAGWAGWKVENGGTANGITSQNIPWSASPPTDGSAGGSFGPSGFVYTVEPGDIAQYGGVIPGLTNARAIMFEGWMAAMQSQGDYGLIWGGAAGTIPGDLWIQFWYFQESGIWNNTYGHPKFIYPHKLEGFRTVVAGLGHSDWLYSRNYTPRLPRDTRGNVAGERYANLRIFDQLWYPSAQAISDGEADASGHVDEDHNFGVGVWQCHRTHINTSAAAVGAGRQMWEHYVRNYGEANFVRTTLWQHGLPPGCDDPTKIPTGNELANFSWPIDATNGYGHASFITPANTDDPIGPFSQNNRYALSDFAMARGVDDGGPGSSALPEYADYGY